MRHIFSYSPRPGTPAARMPQLDRATIKRRAAELRAAARAARDAWLGAAIGRPASVLAERDGTGHGEDFAPYALPAGARAGELLTLVPARIEEGRLA